MTDLLPGMRITLTATIREVYDTHCVFEFRIGDGRSIAPVSCSEIVTVEPDLPRAEIPSPSKAKGP